MVRELAARYTWQSVLLVDEEYRQRQAKQGFPWGTDAPHLGTVMLRDRGLQLAPQQKKATTGGNANRSRPIGPSGKELCLQFNRGTFHYGARCQYEHHTPSTAFRHLLPNSARFSYATEGTLFISAQLSSDGVSGLRKVWVLI